MQHSPFGSRTLSETAALVELRRSQVLLAVVGMAREENTSADTLATYREWRMGR